MINDAEDRALRMRAVRDDPLVRREFVTKRNGKWYAGTTSSFNDGEVIFVVAWEFPSWVQAMSLALSRWRVRERARRTGEHPGQDREPPTFLGPPSEWAVWMGAPDA
jgi:hypothetical protein